MTRGTERKESSSRKEGSANIPDLVKRQWKQKEIDKRESQTTRRYRATRWDFIITQLKKKVKETWKK